MSALPVIKPCLVSALVRVVDDLENNAWAEEKMMKGMMNEHWLTEDGW